MGHEEGTRYARRGNGRHGTLGVHATDGFATSQVLEVEVLNEETCEGGKGTGWDGDQEDLAYTVLVSKGGG